MSSNTNNEIKSKVMRRVYIVSYIRRALSPMALKLYAVVFLLWGIGRQVFVAKVIENAPSFSKHA